jgi:hypothetical protein
LPPYFPDCPFARLLLSRSKPTHRSELHFAGFAMPHRALSFPAQTANASKSNLSDSMGTALSAQSFCRNKPQQKLVGVAVTPRNISPQLPRQCEKFNTMVIVLSVSI